MRSPLHEQVDSLPELVEQMVDSLAKAVRGVLTKSLAGGVARVYLTGCGDSFHAGISATLSFRQYGGTPCFALPAMTFARYHAPTLPAHSLILAVSVSGGVSRTIEAMDLGQQAGGLGVALTGNPKGGLANVAENVVFTKVPQIAGENAGIPIPGVRSYVASQLALHLCAIQLGEIQGHLTKTAANKLRHKIANLGEAIAHTIAHCDPITHAVSEAWGDATQFHFCGAGPNHGTALFSAAKIAEASGDPATAQESEEWAHIEYFAKQENTPTFFITGGTSDIGRTRECATAAKAIGRRVAIIGSADCDVADKDVLLGIAGTFPEPLSPLLTHIPAVLFAAYRAQQVGEPYFRDFGGGRSAEGGGGISRIRTSDRWTKLP